MKTKLTIVMAFALVLTVSVAYMGNAGENCNKSTAQTTGSGIVTAGLVNAKDACCAQCCQAAAAAVTANAHDCCKETVANYMTSCSETSSAAVASATGCCLKSIEAVNAAYAKMASTCSHASVASAGCSKTAAAATVASTSGCSRGATAASAELVTANVYDNVVRTASSDCCAKTTSTAGVASADGQVACDRNKTASTTAAGTVASGSCEQSASAASFAKIDAKAGKEIVLTGSYACGHCDLQLTEGCAAVFKTADGQYYRLVKSDKAASLKKAEGDKFEIVTRVTEVDGEKYLELQTFKTL